MAYDSNNGIINPILCLIYILHNHATDNANISRIINSK